MIYFALDLNFSLNILLHAFEWWEYVKIKCISWQTKFSEWVVMDDRLTYDFVDLIIFMMILVPVKEEFLFCSGVTVNL